MLRYMQYVHPDHAGSRPYGLCHQDSALYAPMFKKHNAEAVAREHRNKSPPAGRSDLTHGYHPQAEWGRFTNPLKCVFWNGRSTHWLMTKCL